MPTRDQIAANIANNLEDAGLAFFSATDINNSIQDGYDDLSSYVMQIEKTFVVNQEANRVYYNLSSLIGDQICVVRVYNNSTNMWLQRSSSKILDQIRWDWEVWTGEPRHFFPHTWDYLAVAPHKVAAVGSFIIYYRAVADTLVASSVPQIKGDEHRLIEKYATADLLIQAKEWEKAQSWFQDYNNGLEQYRNDTKTLASSDFVTGLHG